MERVETVTGAIDASDLGTDARPRAPAGAATRRSTRSGPTRPRSAAIRPARSSPAASTRRRSRPPAPPLELGVRTICDPTAMFLGRDVGFMRRVAEETGLQVVACTGIYTYDHLPTFFVSRDPDQIADLFVADIETGIQGTDIKAAFIKCAADEPGVTENVEKVHRAAARAHLRTGAPIMAHSRPASDTAPRADRDLRGGGRRPRPGPDRPLRRQPRRRLRRAAARPRRLRRASTAAGSRCTCPTSSGWR